MGKMRMGILDGFVGKVGTVVGSFWKGMKVMRGYNEFPANPQTDKQVLQRAKFALLASMSGALLNMLHIGLKERAAKNASTEGGEFLKMNLANVNGSTPESLEVNYTELQLSDGPLSAVMPGEIDLETPLTVKTSIEDSYYDQRFNKQTDTVYLVVYSKTGNEAVISDGNAKRNTGSVEVTVPGYWQGHYVEAWIFVEGTNTVSKSVYVGSGRIA